MFAQAKEEMWKCLTYSDPGLSSNHIHSHRRLCIVNMINLQTLSRKYYDIWILVKTISIKFWHLLKKCKFYPNVWYFLDSLRCGQTVASWGQLWIYFNIFSGHHWTHLTQRYLLGSTGNLSFTKSVVFYENCVHQYSEQVSFIYIILWTFL